jgi:N-acyl-D-aspartate/D-glutamate deacylase
VEEARAEGLDVTVDNDVHTDLGPALVDCLPQSIQHYSIGEIQALLKNPQSRRQLQAEIVNDRRPAFGPAGLLRHGRWERVILLHAPNNQPWVGQSIASIASQSGKDPFDAYFDLILSDGAQATAIFDYIAEENIRILLQHPAVMICSDGAVSADYGPLHDPSAYTPCSFGEFPGVLERYVRDTPLLTLEQAIRKMTSFPAQKLGLWDRGVLRPGAWADVVVLDLERIHDRATNLWPHSYPFENVPHRYPQGIEYVFVNGRLVVEGERHTGELAGVVLKNTC